MQNANTHPVNEAPVEVLEALQLLADARTAEADAKKALAAAKAEAVATLRKHNVRTAVVSDVNLEVQGTLSIPTVTTVHEDVLIEELDSALWGRCLKTVFDRAAFQELVDADEIPASVLAKATETSDGTPQVKITERKSPGLERWRKPRRPRKVVRAS